MNQKTVYLFDFETGEYLYLQICPESPREAGTYLLPPAGTYTTEEPPESVGHTWPVLTKGKWLLVPDFRGVNVWEAATGRKITITEINKKPTVEYVETEPIGIKNPIYDNGEWREKTEKELWSDSYNDDKETCLENMSACITQIYSTKKLRAGITYDGHIFRTDEDTMANASEILTSLNSGITSILPIPWMSADGTRYQFASLAEYRPLAESYAVFKFKEQQKKFLAKQQIEEASSFSDAWNIYSDYCDVISKGE